jgi:anionic cell wall polymer biosynthesis LytR-Cps2A-Psr (LCP) family protein
MDALIMNTKELDSLRKLALHHSELSPNTKTNIISSDLIKLTANIKKQLFSKRDIEVLVLEIKS